MAAQQVGRAPALRRPVLSRQWTLPRQINGQTVAYVILYAIVANLVIVPIAMLIATSVNVGPIVDRGGITLANYVTAWTSPTTYTILANTLIFAVLSSTIAVAIGVFFAFMVERTDMPLKSLVYASVMLNIAMPGLLYSIAWVLLLSPNIGLFNLALLALFGAQGGFFTSWAGIGFAESPIQPYSMGGMVFVEALRGVGVVFLMTGALFRNMDPSLEEAGATSGASARTVASRITLRLMLPGILAAYVYFFTGALESFDIPAIMGMPAGIHVLATKIYLLAGTDEHGVASALGMLFVGLAIVFVLWYGRLTRQIERYSTITGKGYRPRPMRIGRFRYLATAFVALYLVCVVVAPFVVLLWASIQPFYQIPSIEGLGRITFQAYHFVFFNPWGVTALRNTLVVTLVAPTLTVIMAALLSWLVVRSRLRGRRLLDVLAFLPHTLPSVIISLALIYLFLTPPWKSLTFYGTVWIIAVAFVTRYLPFSSRSMHSAVLQIHKELEEAALVGGVTWRKTFFHVILPLLFPALISCWVFVALHAVRDVSMALMLYSPNSRVVSILMWDTWQSGDVPVAAATGVVLMLAIGVLALAGRLVDQHRVKKLAGG